MLKKVLLLLCSVLLAVSLPASAKDLPTYRLECNNGVFTPLKLEVPAGTKFRLEIYNTGTEAVEFESKQLRKEKVLSPKSSSFVVIYPLDPGQYDFFDDFHLSSPHGSIVAK